MVSGKWTVGDAMVYQKGEAPTPTRARPITTNQGVARESYRAGGLCEFGLLNGSNPDIVTVEEPSEFHPGRLDAVAVVL